MLGNADDLLLLMSQKIDTLVSSDPKLLQDANQLLLDIRDVQLKKR